MADPADRIATLEHQLAEARATITRLNRRCQQADAALAEKIVLSKLQSPNLGRALGNYAASLRERERDEARAVAVQVWREGWPADGVEPRWLSIDEQAEQSRLLEAWAEDERKRGGGGG